MLRGVEGDDDQLMLRVNGVRDASGAREYHEVLMDRGIMESSGGTDGRVCHRHRRRDVSRSSAGRS